MADPRYAKLAKLLVEYSTQLKRGERVLLDLADVPDEFTIELMRAVRKVGLRLSAAGIAPHARNARAAFGH